MRTQLVLTVVSSLIVALAPPAPSWAQGPGSPMPSALSPAPQQAKAALPAADLFRFEPTGLSLLRPYTRGKIPVVFVHGLWLNPCSWAGMIRALEAEPSLNDRYQFWTFGYSTGDPIPHTSNLLRQNLDEARRRFDPDNSDLAFTQMVIVGHSMGGLLSKMMVVESGTGLWRVVTDRSFEELAGEPADRELFREALFFGARPDVRRVVFIATPHQGSRVDRGSIQRLGTRLMRLPDPLRQAHHRLITRNEPSFFREHFRKGLPTSIDELEWGSPILTGLHALQPVPTVKVHSIIAVLPDPSLRDRTDGLVTYTSAHVDGVASEKLVATGHLCQEHPDVIREVRRILVEHATP